MFTGIDLSSDTVTRPSAAMKRAMCEAVVGDEQKGEDPSTRQLEQTVARLLGKSAALFVPSATLANQLAIRLHCEPGDELMAYEKAHVFVAEVGGGAVHSGVQAKPIPSPNGIFSGDDLRRHTRWFASPLQPRPRLVAVENTTNMGGGVPWSARELADVLEAARELELKTHLDGARLFNAAVKTGMTPAAIAGGFDSITICLSKGLGCAAGAVLAFDSSQWPRARRLKQLMGGSLRQSGLLAAAGLYALENHVSDLALDHRHAARLAEGLREVPSIALENPEPATNMVFFSVRPGKLAPADWLAACVRNGVRFSQVDRNRFRAVTHRDVGAAEIDTALERVRALN